VLPILLPGVTATVLSTQFLITGTSITEWVLTVIFNNVAAGFVMPQLVALATNGATVIQSPVAENGFSTVVSNGAALQLDLAASPTGQPVTNKTPPPKGNAP